MDDEYSRHNRENLPLPIPMQLSKKPKLFSCNVIEFLEFTLNFEHFEKKKRKKKMRFLKLLTPIDVDT